MQEQIFKLVVKFFQFYFYIIKMLVIWSYRLIWTYTLSHVFKFAGSEALEAWNTARLFKTLSIKETEKVRSLLTEANLFEKDRDNDFVFPNVSKKGGEFFVYILNSQKIEDFEKYLRGFGEIFNTSFVDLEKKEGNCYRLVADCLPDLIKYDERPEEDKKGFWIGTDFRGKSVFLNFLHTPAMLITGASGSGKSVLARVIIEEATKAGYKTYIVDGKGGIDWMDAPCEKMLTDFEEIAEHYEELLEEMNTRLKQLVEFRCKNWLEANAAGHEIKPILSLMDESSDFFEIGSKTTDKNYAVKWRIVNAINELCRKSRSVGIYQVFSLQAAKAESVPNDVKNNAGFRVSYALPTSAMSQTLFESSIAFDATLRGGKGVFKGVEGDAVIFRGAYIAE